jgi:dienelactone hydrolase
MRWGRTVLSLVMSIHLFGAAAAASPFEGEWLGGFEGAADWIFLQLRVGGEGQRMAARADLPTLGLRGMLLQRVEARDRRVTFDMPATGGSLRFEGDLREPGRITGRVLHEGGTSPFELLLMRPGTADEWQSLAGDYEEAASGQVLLVYVSGGALFYLDHATGRAGRLYPLADGRFVAGPAIGAGFPIELTVRFEQDADGRAVALSWARRGDALRHARRRAFYRVERASIPADQQIVLSGALLIPNGRGPHPAVVVIPGSGQVTAESLLPYADVFARHGVAVLIHDRRGVGRSTGDYETAGIHELAQDALAGVRWLKAQPGIDSARIGVVGTSLGGWVAPLAATRSEDVKFVMIEAAPAVTPAEHERLRVRNQMMADGQPAASVQRALEFMDRKLDVGRTGEGWEALDALIGAGTREGWIRYVNAPASLESLRWNYEHVLSYDPQPALRKLRVPVLAVYGALDRVVDPGLNVSRLESALRDAGNRDVTLRVLPGANHHFLAAVTGGPGEVPRLKGFADGYFEARTDWIREHVSETAPAAVASLRPAQAASAPGGGLP